MGANITVEGGPQLPEIQEHLLYDAVSPEYFSTIGVPLVAGREFDSGDTRRAAKLRLSTKPWPSVFFLSANRWGPASRLGPGMQLNRTSDRRGSKG